MANEAGATRGETYLILNAAEVPHLSHAIAAQPDLMVQVLPRDDEAQIAASADAWGSWYAADGPLSQSEAPGDSMFGSAAEAAAHARTAMELGGVVLRFINPNGPEAPDVSRWHAPIVAAMAEQTA